jgi:16S rRNA (adenine1518-N6/adenine1519-N6)-dimethyltransferase
VSEERESLLSGIRSLLQRHGLAANKRLGQHFMIDRSAVQALVGALGGEPRRVVEVGPGTGVLSAALLEAGHEVLAVELDAGMTTLLRERFTDCALTLVHGDALAGKNALHPAIVDWAAAGPWALAANLPYDASLPILLNALQLPRPPADLVVTVQLEAAERLCAAPGSDAWGATAAVAQAAGEGSIIRRLSPRCFHPPPRVQSAILHWRSHRLLSPDFGRWCRQVFAYRRKLVERGLRDAGLDKAAAAQLCQRCGIAAQTRIEGLTVAELLALHAGFEGEGS